MWGLKQKRLTRLLHYKSHSLQVFLRQNPLFFNLQDTYYVFLTRFFGCFLLFYFKNPHITIHYGQKETELHIPNAYAVLVRTGLYFINHFLCLDVSKYLKYRYLPMPLLVITSLVAY